MAKQEEKRITFKVPIEEYNTYQQHADEEGVSLMIWIRRQLMESTGYKNVEIQGVTTVRRKQRLPDTQGKYARYDLDAARAYIDKKEREGELTRKEERQLKIIRKAVEKIDSPGRRVLTEPQRREMKRWRLANFD